jgi:hypothetical protein
VTILVILSYQIRAGEEVSSPRRSSFLSSLVEGSEIQYSWIVYRDDFARKDGSMFTERVVGSQYA